jgi:hypothetical protein
VGAVLAHVRGPACALDGYMRVMREAFFSLEVFLSIHLE